MNLDTYVPVSHGSGPSHRAHEAYEPSVISSASSSQSSTFSDASAQSSIASSVSDDFRSSHEDLRERDRICAQSHLQYQARTGQVKHSELNPAVAAHLSQALSHAAPTYADVTSLPSGHRQHPRRCSVSKDRQPPQLVRQRDRKVDFVDNLVDSAAQMVEVIWPLSVVPCQAEGSGRGVLPLRTYIEETLRRSRTSYSTLQVALYYLILIMPLVPTSDFTMEQSSICPADRALLCGRRMFLSALILASKYLQDRNYSAKAWSKMSGLKITEINTNERTFLEKVNWRLHIPKPTFEKWQELVLRYTPRPPMPGQRADSTTLTWKNVVPMLTPELDTIPMPRDSANKAVVLEPTSCLGFISPAATPTPTKNTGDPFNLVSDSSESTPTPTTALPRFLEPKPDLLPPTPGLARMGPLPTPQMTPSTVATNTPAASVCGSRRSSMCSAMAMLHKANFSRCAVDAFASGEIRQPVSRRPSLMSIASFTSSPESMVTDRTRATSVSSTSSVSTFSSMAPQRVCLARRATCRNVRLPLPAMLREEQEEGSATKPILIDDDAEMTASPDFADFSVSEKALRAPHRHSKHSNHIKPAAMCERSRKRCRPHGHGRSDAVEEISSQLQDYHAEEMEVDENFAPQSDAVYYARGLLSRSSSEDSVGQDTMDKYHSPSPLSNRVAVRNNRGNKRSCVPADFSVYPVSRQYGEIM